MKNVVNKVKEDKGSFTVEASIITIFIVIIIVNLILLVLRTYDKCLIYKEVNNNIFLINEKADSLEQYKIENSSWYKEYENLKINSKLMCTSVMDISYRISRKEISVYIKYRINDNKWSIIKDKNIYYIRRRMRLFNIKNKVRSMEKSCYE